MELPKNAHKEDIEFIKSQIDSLPVYMRQKAIIGYDNVFNNTYANTPVEHQKLNKARREANIRLRHFIDKCANAAMGYTEKPPIARD